MLGNDARFFGRGVRIVLVSMAVAAVAVAIDPGTWSGSRGGCITLKVDSPILLPNGDVYPPGALTLCDTLSLTPVSTIHKTFIDGHPVAMLSSRKTRSEGGEKIEPLVMFSRDPQGRLGLIGYVIPGKQRSITYLLDETKKPARRQSRGAVATASSQHPATDVETEDSAESSYVMFAARTPR